MVLPPHLSSSCKTWRPSCRVRTALCHIPCYASGSQPCCSAMPWPWPLQALLCGLLLKVSCHTGGPCLLLADTPVAAPAGTTASCLLLACLLLLCLHHSTLGHPALGHPAPTGTLHPPRAPCTHGHPAPATGTLHPPRAPCTRHGHPAPTTGILHPSRSQPLCVCPTHMQAQATTPPPVASHSTLMWVGT